MILTIGKQLMRCRVALEHLHAGSRM